MFWQIFALNECNLFLEEQVDVLSERRTGAPYRSAVPERRA